MKSIVLSDREYSLVANAVLTQIPMAGWIQGVAVGSIEKKERSRKEVTIEDRIRCVRTVREGQSTAFRAARLLKKMGAASCPVDQFFYPMIRLPRKPRDPYAPWFEVQL